MKKSIKFFEASRNPIKDLALVTYAGQDPARRMYQTGYEKYLDRLPLLEPGDLLEGNLKMTEKIMCELASDLKTSTWLHENKPDENGFNRTIVAMESPLKEDMGLSVIKEGTEIVVAKWGNHHTSPVHGHADGFIYEHILYGAMRVNTYRIVDEANKMVRPTQTIIARDGRFASAYLQNKNVERGNLVHNFVSIGQSATLHLIPEHTRDGRDNKFVVDYFENNYFLTTDDVTRITAKQGLYSRIGDVILVRSNNVPEYGDHFIVITGHPIVKDHGLRPQDIAIMTSPNAISMLDLYDMEMGLTLLKLNDKAKQAFHEFHGMVIEKGNVKF